MDSDIKKVVIKQLKYVSKRKSREENQIWKIKIIDKLEPAVEIEVSFLKFKTVETQYKTCLPKILFLTFKKIQIIVVFKYLHCSKISKGYPPFLKCKYMTL